MTREEAIAIIRKEYLCVDRDCDIERLCGKCDLMMPSKEPILEAYKMAIKALEQQPKTGHWIDTDSDSFEFHRIYKCSECGNTQIEYPENIHERFRYCPNCGCRMVEPQERSDEEI
jgi:ribosomal protein S27E